MLKWFISWLASLFGAGRDPPVCFDIPPKTVVPLLIYPRDLDDAPLGQEVSVGADRYFMSGNIEVPQQELRNAIISAEAWLNGVLEATVPWADLIVLDSQRSLDEWRGQRIGLLKREIKDGGLPWTKDYVYIAFVRGMGGYAGGISYESDRAGYAMVGDICLESVCLYPAPNAAFALLGADVWPDSARSALGQTAAFIHEALHGLDLPHPDGWPEDDRPESGDTIMGHWWNMPNFSPRGGLTNRETERVKKWLA